MKNPSIKDIVKKYLDECGYDGLYNSSGWVKCACELSDLFPCECPDEDHCKAGYKCEPPDDEKEADFWICSTKENQNEPK
jgi:hypothetical protein